MSSTFTNILSISRIVNFEPQTIFSSSVITTVYFVFIGLIPFFFTLYCYEFVSQHKAHKVQFFICMAVPFVMYFIVLALNPFYGCLFRYDENLGYIRGKLKNVTYVVTLAYALIILASLFTNRKVISKRTKVVFLIYPFLGICISSIQFFTTYCVMTGTSSFATMLLVYLSVQSDLHEYDIQTGLLTEKHLSRILTKKPEGILAIITVENFSLLEASLSIYSFNTLVLAFSARLSALFPRSAYHISANKFAVLSNDLDTLKKNLGSFFSEFEQIRTEDNTNHYVEFIAAAVELPKNAETYEEAINTVNNLLFRARAKKGTRFIFCDDNYMAEKKRAQQIYSILDRELRVDSEQLQIYLQPIYSISQNRFIYAEALSRLIGTELGDISPAEFVSVAEQRGLIERLGNVVFEKICEFISLNKEKVHALSVNFSVYQMMNPGIVDYVLDTIRKFGIKPGNIIMEITESIFIQDFELIRSHMTRLSEAGVCFYLDDFGTGYSNFANVILLPFTTIKIDRSFVLKMESSRELVCLTRSLIHTFKENGLKILVEGIETKIQDDIIRNADADYIQGFLYSRPIPADEFLSLISSQ